MTIFNKVFWADAAERAAKSVAQALLLLFGTGQQVFNIFTVNPKQAFGIAGGAAVLSVLTSIVSAKITSSDSASLSVKTISKG